MKIFFDIASLTGHLIERNQPPSAGAKGAGFDSYLNRSSNNDEFRREDAEESNQSYAVLGDFEPAKMATSPTDNPRRLSNRPAEACESLRDDNPSGPVLEKLSAGLVQSARLKQWLASQKATLTLEIPANNARYDLLAEVNADLKMLFENKNTVRPISQFQSGDGIIKNMGPPPDTNGVAVLKDQSILDELRSVTSYLNNDSATMLSRDSNASKLTFAINALWEESDRPAPVRITGNTAFDTVISAGKLRELVESYPEKITVEIKAPGIGFFTGKSEPALVPSPEKHLIFELKSLLSKEDSEKISVVEKTIFVESKTAVGQSIIGATNQPRLGQTQMPDLGRGAGYAQYNAPADLAGNRSYLQAIGSQANVAESYTAEEVSGNEPSAPKVGQLIDSALDVGRGISNGSLPKDGDTLPVNQVDIKILSGQADPVQNGSIMSRHAPFEISENIERIINQLKSNLVVTAGNVKLTIKLKPKGLGKIGVRLTYEGDKVEALLRVENPEVKRALDAEMPRLRYELKVDHCRIESYTNAFAGDYGPSGHRSHNSKAGGDTYLQRFADDEAADMKEKNYKGYHNGRIDLFA